MLAYDPAREAVRTFVLGRMREVALTDERFERQKDFDPKQEYGASLGVMSGKGDYQVVVELYAWLTDILRGRRWHPTQEWTEVAEGGAQLRMQLSCLEPVVNFFRTQLSA